MCEVGRRTERMTLRMAAMEISGLLFFGFGINPTNAGGATMRFGLILMLIIGPSLWIYWAGCGLSLQEAQSDFYDLGFLLGCMGQLFLFGSLLIYPG